MAHTRDHPAATGRPTRRGLTASTVALICVGAIFAFLLVMEHRAHLLGVWPYLLLLACPLMHLLMHGGHGHHHGKGDRP